MSVVLVAGGGGVGRGGGGKGRGQVSDLLERLYGRLDTLADAHGVFRLETIGDAYLCLSWSSRESRESRGAKFAESRRIARRSKKIRIANRGLTVGHYFQAFRAK